NAPFTGPENGPTNKMKPFSFGGMVASGATAGILSPFKSSVKKALEPSADRAGEGVVGTTERNWEQYQDWVESNQNGVPAAPDDASQGATTSTVPTPAPPTTATTPVPAPPGAVPKPPPVTVPG